MILIEIKNEKTLAYLNDCLEDYPKVKAVRGTQLAKISINNFEVWYNVKSKKFFATNKQNLKEVETETELWLKENKHIAKKFETENLKEVIKLVNSYKNKLIQYQDPGQEFSHDVFKVIGLNKKNQVVVTVQNDDENDGKRLKISLEDFSKADTNLVFNNKLNSKKSKGDRTMKATKRTTRKNRATSKSSVNFSNTISKVKSLLKGFENLSFHTKDNFLGVKINGKRVMQVTVRNSGSNVMFNNLTLKAGKKLNKQVEERNGSAVVKEFDLKNISGLKSLLMASAKAIES